MTTAFQRSAFADDSFQIDEEGSVETPAPSGGGHWTPVRYFTPLPGRRERKRIDQAIEEEKRLRLAIEAVTDVDTIGILMDELEQIQKLILMMALESSVAYEYIQMRRQEEDEEISLLMSLM